MSPSSYQVVYTPMHGTPLIMIQGPVVQYTDCPPKIFLYLFKDVLYMYGVAEWFYGFLVVDTLDSVVFVQ